MPMDVWGSSEVHRHLMKEGYMKSRYLALIITGTMLLGACATSGDEEVAPAAPVGAGAIVGTVAADRDCDGKVDGYYTSDGIYHEFQLGRASGRERVCQYV